MQDTRGVAARLAPVLTRILGERLPIRIRAWDGSTVGPTNAPTFVIHDRRALRRLLWKPGELGLARAYVAGELDIEGDLVDALGAVARALRDRVGEPLRLSGEHKREIIKTAVILGAVGPEPRPPAEELPHGWLLGHGATSPHPLPGGAPESYEAFLGPAMTFSAAYWAHPDDPSTTLEDAQRDNFDLVCRKLGLMPGMRLLDADCGFGSLLCFAARNYGVTGVGVTSSPQRAAYARERITREGLADRVEIRVCALEEVADGPFDAVASIGGAGEQLGGRGFAEHARALASLVHPGGRVANQQVVRRPGRVTGRPTFVTSYIFPDAALLPLGGVVTALEEAGLEVRDVLAMREHYARTIRHWIRNLQRQSAGPVFAGSQGVARVWLLYLAATAVAFDIGRLGVHQLLSVLPTRESDRGTRLDRQVRLAFTA